MSRLSLIESELSLLPPIEALDLPACQDHDVHVDCLRLDKIHPFVSGNKWYKLQHHLLAAQAHHKTSLLSFGGAYSNHLHALAFAGKKLQIPTIGLVRGERIDPLNPTLEDCEKWGMQLNWVPRDEYRAMSGSGFQGQLSEQYPDAWIIPEGGEGLQGLAGVQELFSRLYHECDMPYDLIVCPVGTGTTLAGIILAAGTRAQVLGYSALKNAFDLEARVEQMLSTAVKPLSDWEICHQFHFGGFAKTNHRLTDFISMVHSQTGILLDPVYTGKALYGLCEWVRQRRILSGAKVLMVHTGGLQGWRGMGGARPA